MSDFDLRKYLAEGKLYEAINLDIQDNIATLSGDSGEYEGEIDEDGKVSFSVIYDDLDTRITDQYDESNIEDFLGKNHAFVELVKSRKYDYKWDIEPDLVGITIKLNNLSPVKPLYENKSYYENGEKNVYFPREDDELENEIDIKADEIEVLDDVEDLNIEKPIILNININENILFEALIAELKDFEVGQPSMELKSIGGESRSTLDNFRSALNNLITKEPRLQKATEIIKNNLKTNSLIAAIVNRYNTLTRLERSKLKKSYDKSGGPDIYYDEDRKKYIDRRTGRFAKKEDIDTQIKKDIEDGDIEKDPSNDDNWYVKGWKKNPGNQSWLDTFTGKKGGFFSKMATKAANIVKARQNK